MRDVALVGGVPSSGSTLLMRLLAEREGFACLPETGLFAHGDHLLGYGGPDPDGPDLARRVPWLDTPVKIKEALGVTGDRLDRAMAEHTDAFALAEDMFGEPGCLLVEKTPENVFAFGPYLDKNPDARVVVTTRSSLGATQSLMRRGFTMEEAFLVWFAHTYAACELLLKHPGQVYHCAYSALTADPKRVADETADHLRAGRTYAARCDGRHAALFEWALSGLTMRAWTFSPLKPVAPRMETNYLGNRFRVLHDRMRFAPTPGRPVSAGWVEAVLDGAAPETSPDEEWTPVDMASPSPLVQTLISAYRPGVARR